MKHAIVWQNIPSDVQLDVGVGRVDGGQVNLETETNCGSLCRVHGRLGLQAVRPPPRPDPPRPHVVAVLLRRVHGENVAVAGGVVPHPMGEVQLSPYVP